MSTTPPPPAGRRPVLRPGVHVLRRSADQLQVGLDPRRAVVLPDRPGVRAALAALAAPAAPPPEGYDVRTVDLLAAAGLVLDADLLLPLLGRSTPRRPDVAALAAVEGDDAARFLRARGGCVVRTATAGGPEAQDVVGRLLALLEESGVPARTDAPTDAPKDASRPTGASAKAARPRHEGRGEVGVLVSVGEPAREVLDPWTRDGVPHLVLRLVEGHAVLGPFVRPGVTACLRCVDAHHADLDPKWPLLVAQHAAATSRRRDDTVPEPVDSMLAALAAAWAARELVSHAEGRLPSTTSTTIRLDPHLTSVETQAWPCHPGCGCTGL